MNETLEQSIKEICKACNNDKTRMMDIVTEVQKQQGSVSSEALNIIAKEVNANRVEVESVVSFYAFLSKEQKGKTVVRLCNDIVDKMKGYDEIGKIFKDGLGIKLGETTDDGNITLESTPCIGMCDQAPAVLINDVVVTNITSESAKTIISALKENKDTQELVTTLGDGNNADELVKAMVNNNIKKKGEVIFCDREVNAGLKKALTLLPEELIAEIKQSKLRGRGGAGFPTGLKWEFTRGAIGESKYVLCNADEGEPGTFKDRVLLTEYSDLLFEGMTIGGYAIGADSGVVYLRGEYAYLKKFLDKKLEDRRNNNLLGNNVLGKEGFNFDIRIQIGAGAYVCGEETALISSCEGLRGDPKNRPPFPAQKGYLGCPTTVNNVETFCCISRILEKGTAWFLEIGSSGSPGTKLLSISGDCENPGVYEFPFGVTLEEILKEVGAKDTKAVLVGGPSGQFVSKDFFTRTICYDDLATGGAVVIFNEQRNILEVVNSYMEFFVEESCGYCTPCRVGNVLLKKCLENVIAGKGESKDLDYMKELGETVKVTSRCGLGQTSPNPILTTMNNFKGDYEALLKENKEGMQPSFDIKAAIETSEGITGRKSVIFKE